MKQSAVRARIRQLCCLGLPGELLIGSLLPAIRELVPSDSAAFFWVDSRGEMQNLYAERMLPPDLQSLYFERYYDGQEASFRRAFLERATAPEGVVATSADGDLAKTEYYNEILRKLDAHHVLYGIVREQSAALGQLSLYRPMDAPGFTPRERTDLASVMRYVAHGVATGLTQPADDAFTFEDSEQEAMLVTDRSGTIRHASETARRLLLLATTSEINPASLKSAVNQRATAALRALCERLDAVARGDESLPPVLTLDTKWGRHVLRAYWLDDCTAPDALIGVRIQRQEPMILRFVHAMARLPLSPQQREIAILLAQGRSYQEMAAGLGISENTVAYHIKQLFMKLDVHDRAAALKRITGRAPGASPAAG
jgi:DNA-binding CsgD family transcriptional regulator